MKHLDLTLPTSAENLACDEALLDACEEGNADELLRFWEPQQYFVVLGSSKKVKEEVHVDACNADGVPILRRHSGGGTVLQGPGCLNYSLVLKINPNEPTRNITETTNYIMQRHAEALSDLIGEKVEVKGSSDLAVAGRKFSGNAQRRKLKSLLFHGTFLVDFNLELMEKYLKMPPKQPGYRHQRKHSKFVRNISVSSEEVKQRLCSAWNIEREFDSIPFERIEKLVEEKYSREDWNHKM